MPIDLDYRPSGGGAGIELVAELPDPEPGKVVYVKESYYSGEKTVSETSFSITPVAFGTDNIGENLPITGLLQDPNTYNIYQDANRVVYIQVVSILNSFYSAVRGDSTLSIIVNDEAPAQILNTGTPRLIVTTASRWVAGTAITIRFVRNDGKYLAGDGEFYTTRPDDEEEVKEEFYHVDPATNDWREGLGSDGDFHLGAMPREFVNLNALYEHSWNDPNWLNKYDKDETAIVLIPAAGGSYDTYIFRGITTSPFTGFTRSVFFTSESRTTGTLTFGTAAIAAQFVSLFSGNPQNRVMMQVQEVLYQLQTATQDTNTCLLYTSPSPRDS